MILGGTRDARVLAWQLLAQGHEVVSSLAGVTRNPILPEGEVRLGGFGGAAGLRDYLAADCVDVLIDATHPFAEVISRNAEIATIGTRVQLFKLDRPGWTEGPRDLWTAVASISDAVAKLPSGARVFLAIGRKQVGPFMLRADITGILRMIEPPDQVVPSLWQLILNRPGETIGDELNLMRAHNITHLVCKNSGGGSAHKLAAARHLGLPVVMVQRPARRMSDAFASVAEIVEAVSKFTQEAKCDNLPP
jgi:precorrin-6A/cobalt-precorrin-6A reductase